MTLLVRYLDHYNMAAYGPLAYAQPDDAGFDLRAAIDQPLVLEPGHIVAVPNGFSVAVPPGFEMQVRSRSGLSLKGVIVANAPGTVDAGYRGEIKTILTNISRVPYTINPGDRIAQAILAAVAHMPFEPTDVLPDSTRGTGGLGSTGVQ